MAGETVGPMTILLKKAVSNSVALRNLSVEMVIVFQDLTSVMATVTVVIQQMKWDAVCSGLNPALWHCIGSLSNHLYFQHKFIFQNCLDFHTCISNK